MNKDIYKILKNIMWIKIGFIGVFLKTSARAYMEPTVLPSTFGPPVDNLFFEIFSPDIFTPIVLLGLFDVLFYKYFVKKYSPNKKYLYVILFAINILAIIFLYNYFTSTRTIYLFGIYL